MTADKVFIILQSAYQLCLDGEFFEITDFNEEECYLRHCEDQDETVISLEELANSNVDYYKLTKMEID